MIPVCEPTLKGNELKYVSDCIKTGWVSSVGSYVTKFEEEFSKYCGVQNGVSCNGGTAALHLALEALKIKPGSEVIIPNFTMISTAFAVQYAGLKPVVVDANPKTWNIDVSQIEDKITDKTKAIIAVHIYGHPCDMDEINKIAKDHNLFVIEDAAEAHGAEYKGRKTGSLSDLACFSFYGNKIITTGEGGMILTNNKEFAERMEYLGNLTFKKPRYIHDEIGWNYRMPNTNAAIGLAQVERIEELVKGRRDNAKWYNELLKDVDGITLPVEQSYVKNVYWMYGIIIEDNFGITRDKVIEKLLELGVQTRPFFWPMHLQPSINTKNKDDSFPVSEKLGKQGLYLPSSSHLTKEQVEEIVEKIKSLKK
ncbi:hypothetical protein CL621_04225 [archaeon]|nr:hypothetical protein [archaeon]